MSLTTPDKIQNLQSKLYCLTKTVTCRGVVRPTSAMSGRAVVCLAVKPVGKPGAGNRHAPVDERGWETGDGQRAPSYRAHPRLYQLGYCRRTGQLTCRRAVVEKVRDGG